MMSACPESLLGCLSGSVGLGVMPPALALASVPLVHEVVDGRRPSSAALTPAAVAPLVAPQSGVVHFTISYAESTRAGIELSPATSLFPQKLVDRACSGQFVDMRVLLTDSVSLIQQLDTFGGNYAFPSLPGMLRPHLREVMSLPSWIYCFLAYIAIRANDQGVRDMLAYAHLMVREAQRHGGSGWLDYDWGFRQQAALEPSLRWNTLYPRIQAATLVGRTAGSTLLCSICREPDHTAGQCGLSYFQPPTGTSNAPGPSVWPPGPRAPLRCQPESMTNICVSWNKGYCTFPGTCRFRHACTTCQQPHMARDCAATPTHLEYKRGDGGRNPASCPGPRPLFWCGRLVEPKLDTLSSLHIKLTLYLYPGGRHVYITLLGRQSIYWPVLSPTIMLLYLCFVLLSRSCSVFDHNLCACGYSEVFVVVKRCSVSVGSTGVGKGMVSI